MCDNFAIIDMKRSTIRPFQAMFFVFQAIRQHWKQFHFCSKIDEQIYRSTCFWKKSRLPNQQLIEKFSKIPSHHFRSRNSFVYLQLSIATHFLLSFLTINLNELRLLFLQNIVFSYQKVIHIIATCFIFADFILAVLYYEVRKKKHLNAATL